MKQNTEPQTTELQWPPSEELHHVQELEVALEREFPAAAESFSDGFSRRRWLQLMGASMALGGILGCRDQVEKIAPFAFRPKNRVPGVPQQFATSVDFSGVGRPLLATCNDGRPTKLDGNTLHPEGVGSDVFTQSMVLDLYDPDRSRSVREWVEKEYVDASYESFQESFSKVAAKDLFVLAEPNASPTVARLKQKLIDAGARWFEYTPVNRDNRNAGTKMALGKAYRPHYQLQKAKVVVALDADPLGSADDGIVNTSRFGTSRDPDKDWMSRLYSVESTWSLTGSSADHRLAMRSELIGHFLGSLEAAVGEAMEGKLHASDKPSKAEEMMVAMAKDLVVNKGASLVIVGEKQPAEVHARANRLNSKLEAFGKTVVFTEASETESKSYMSQIQALAEIMADDDVKNLLILGGNPAYDAPAGLAGEGFAELLKKVDNSIHFSVTENETSRFCSWHVNAAHPLEVWGDTRAYDGTWCVAQPLIAPIFKGKSTAEFLAEYLGVDGDGLDLVRETAKASWSNDDFEATWNQAVHDGFAKDSQAEAVTASLSGELELKPTDMRWNNEKDSALELVFETSRQLFDGRFSNNGWMQECPDLFTKLTWDNALIVSPRTAKQLKLKQGKKANVTTDGGSVMLPVMVQPGQANGTISVAIGYGRTAAGRVGGDDNLQIKPVGEDVYPLRSVENWHVASEPEVNPTSSSYMLALTQEAATMDKKARTEISHRMGPHSALIRRGTFKEYREFKEHESESHDHKDQHARARNGQSPLRKVSFRPEDEKDTKKTDDKNGKKQDDGHSHGGHHWPTEHHDLAEFDLTPGKPLSEEVRWGMSIDLNKCTGCNACVIACQAENNIPIVGKEQVWRGREMHWLRIDRYYPSPELEGKPNDWDEMYDRAEIAIQPVTCHQCENAPCEQVCPVAATVHSDEGLNDMVYNRCSGTRYCGNNCPYKVRRFNYLNYSNAQTFIKYPGADAWPLGGNELAITGGSNISEADKKLMALVFNPEVTIRSRGVMEKCTYCVQRIQNTKIEARNEDRPIGPNEITTACQDACGCNAIEFGNLSDHESRVHHAHEDSRSYVMLQELNNKPRTRYMARVTNPNPDLVVETEGHGHKGH